MGINSTSSAAAGLPRNPARQPAILGRRRDHRLAPGAPGCRGRRARGQPALDAGLLAGLGERYDECCGLGHRPQPAAGLGRRWEPPRLRAWAARARGTGLAVHHRVRGGVDQQLRRARRQSPKRHQAVAPRTRWAAGAASADTVTQRQTTASPRLTPSPPRWPATVATNHSPPSQPRGRRIRARGPPPPGRRPRCLQPENLWSKTLNGHLVGALLGERSSGRCLTQPTARSLPS